MYGEFQNRDIIILGISPDGEASHQSFIQKFGIPYKLLCDPQKKIMEKYDAFGEKKMFGKLTKGVIRSTVWVGPDGKVIKHWRKVANAEDHPADVLDAIKAASK